MMTPVEIIEDCITNGTRHANYEAMCRVAEWSRQIYTGEGQEVLIREIRPDETEEQKELRVQISDPETPEVLYPAAAYYEKTFRTDGVKTLLFHHQDRKRAEAVQQALHTFSGGRSAYDYLSRQQLHYEATDPNAWLLVDRWDERGAEGQIVRMGTFPHEVPSERAVNYGLDAAGQPLWLIELMKGMEQGAKQKYPVECYLYYAAGVLIRYQEYVEVVPPAKDGPVQAEYLTLIDALDRPRQFARYVYRTGSKEFPGMKFGAYRNPSNEDLSFRAPFYYLARYVLHRIVKGASLKAVCKWKHVYPRRWQWGYECTHEQDGYQCDQGLLNGRTCPKCHGTGRASMAKSELEAVVLKLPDIEDKNDIIPISQFVFYEQPPLDATTWVSEDLEADKRRVLLTIFNSQSEDRPVAPRTATENLLNYEQVNNRVYPFAAHTSRLMEKIARLTAQYMDYDQGFVYAHSYPRNLGLEPLEVLLDKLRQARESGAPQAVVQALECEILLRENADNPGVVDDYLAYERHRPMRSFPAETALLILQARDPLDRTRLLYENFDEVKTLVGQRTTDFAGLSFDRQTQEIDTALAVIRGRMTLPTAPLEVPFLGGMGEDEPMEENA